MLASDEKKKIQRRFTSLQNEAQQWRDKWRDISTYLSPSRGNFNDEIPTKPKTIDNQALINSAPSMALRTLAAAFSSGMTPSSRPWFKVGLRDPELEKYKPVARWLQAVEDLTYDVYAKSNYYQAQNKIYYECPLYGIGSVMMDEDFERVIKMTTFTAGEYFVGHNAWGRSYWMMVEEVVDVYGINNVSVDVRDAYNRGDKERWVKCCQLIEKNPKADPYSLDSKSMAYRSVSWEDGKMDQSILRESGYHEMPVQCPRWDTPTTSSLYGISPAYELLGDIKMLQNLEVKKILAIDLSVQPPVQFDASVDQDFILMPGEAVPTSGVGQDAGVKPIYQVKLDLDHIRLEIANVMQRIDMGFFKDLLLLASQSDINRTAREVMVRQEEKFMVLAPVLEMMKNELLDPQFDRLFGIMTRAGMIPPPPPELRGQEINPRYTSVLAQAQKMIGTNLIEEHVLFATQVAQINPESLDVTDWDQAVLEYAAKKGTPADLIRDAEEVQMIRANRAKANQQAQQMAINQAMVDGSKTLSETKLNQGSALDRVIETAGARQ